MRSRMIYLNSGTQEHVRRIIRELSMVIHMQDDVSMYSKGAAMLPTVYFCQQTAAWSLTSTTSPDCSNVVLLTVKLIWGLIC